MTDQIAPSDAPAKRYATAGDYVQLLKPRIMMLVVFTAVAGLVAAVGVTGTAMNPLMAVIALLAIALGSGAAGAINMWYDADIDAVMGRTVKRPIPDGRITPNQALTYGSILSIFSVLTMGVVVNWLASFLLAFTIFFYAVVYTMWLKRSTPQNIVIGGAAGAFPPMIGWAAVTGTVTIESIVLFAIIFIWTPPHFWALALFRSEDYQKANVPMMPNVRGDASTRLQIMAYSVVLAGTGLLPYFLGFASLVYGVLAAALGAAFVWFAFKVWQKPDSIEGHRPEKQLFGFSIIYLFVLFAELGIEALIQRMWS